MHWISVFFSVPGNPLWNTAREERMDEWVMTFFVWFLPRVRGFPPEEIPPWVLSLTQEDLQDEEALAFQCDLPREDVKDWLHRTLVSDADTERRFQEAWECLVGYYE